jgi:hypothetical protein
MSTPSYTLSVTERHTLRKSVFLPALNKTVDLFIAIQADEDTLLKYTCDQFSRNEPVDSALG